jgi:starch phosphorylase
VARTSLVEEGQTKQIRMANLAIVGSHSTNASPPSIPSSCARPRSRISPRRFPAVQQQDQRGDAQTVAAARKPLPCRNDLERHRLDHRSLGIAKASAAHGRRRVHRECSEGQARAKARFADWVKRHTDVTVDPDTIFDCQIKRIHEYKRQLLNALRIVVLYQRLRENPDIDVPPRTFFFAGKAAPAYDLAKVIIKFINNLAQTLDGDPAIRGTWSCSCRNTM